MNKPYLAMLTVLLVSLLMSLPGYAEDKKDEIFEAEPKLRIAPIMPPTAKDSGYCCMIYDINKYGRTKNITAAYCTNAILFDPSIRAVKKWRYSPKLVNWQPMVTKGKWTYVSYRLRDMQGRLIKNADGYPEFEEDGEHLKEHYCSEYVS